MIIRTPQFLNKKGFISNLLLPISFIWIFFSKLKSKFAKSINSPLPVICIGNISIGGSGKTPLTREISKLLKERGYNTCILTKGYKGKAKGPILVNKNLDTVKEIGDEPLMLNKYDQVCVSKDRYSGVNFINEQTNADVIIMDDGMQNPHITKDFTIGVFDGKHGIQNGRIIPAGPLRETMEDGVKKIDIFFINGNDRTNLKNSIPESKLTINGKLLPCRKKVREIKNKKYIAFSGINDPQRFFSTLIDNNVILFKTFSFPDHYNFKESDLKRIYNVSCKFKCRLITTEKDWVRLTNKWRNLVNYLEVNFQIEKNQKTKMINQILSKLKEN